MRWFSIFGAMLEFICILFIIAPLLPLLPFTHWSIRFFDFVRVQIVALQLCIIAAILVIWSSYTLLQWILFLSLLAVVIYQIWLILPYTPFYRRKKVKRKLHPEYLKLLIANVLQTNTAYDKFIGIVKQADPDIFITMESDEKWDNAVSEAFPEYEHTVKATLDNFYGMHLYSKIPLKKSEIKYLVESDIPSMHCEIDYADQTFNLISVHPAPPSPTENETSSERDAELMLVAEQCRTNEEATVVCGDLNDVVWSKTSRLFKKITGYLDPRIGRGLYPSFHANYWLLRFPLDHLFYTKDLHVSTLRRLRRFGSDHFAMYYHIHFPEMDVDVPNPSISREEEREVAEIIDEGLLSARAQAN